MSVLVAAVLGVGFGLGFLLVLAALTNRPVLVAPNVEAALRRIARSVAVGRAAAAGAAALVAVAVTGWLAAGGLTALAVLFGPRLLGGRGARRASIARTEAIAAWTELVRDSIAAASGLEEAIVATLPVAPTPIRGEVRLLVERVQRQSLPDALAAFGADLAHPSADFVVVALSTAARMEAADLSELLSRLAEAIRGEARMRTHVEVGRARVRTATRIIVGSMAAFVGVLMVFNRGYLAAYDTADGQRVMLAVGAIWAVGAWMLARMGTIEAPQRFAARTGTGTPP